MVEIIKCQKEAKHQFESWHLRWGPAGSGAKEPEEFRVPHTGTLIQKVVLWIVLHKMRLLELQ